MTTRLNVGGPAIQAVLLSARLDPDRFESLLVAATESANEGNMIELGRLDPPAALAGAIDCLLADPAARDGAGTRLDPRSSPVTMSLAW